MNKQSAHGQLRKDLDDLRDNGQLGDWCFFHDDKVICIRMPCEVDSRYPFPRGDMTNWRIHPDAPQLPGVQLGAVWQWNGNREAPTLDPSLHWIDTWHGFMHAGQLVSC